MPTYTYIRQLFVDGLNSDILPAAIDLFSPEPTTVTRVAQSQNFLFERGLAVTRPSVLTTSDGTNLLPTVKAVMGVRRLPWIYSANIPSVRTALVAVTDMTNTNRLFFQVSPTAGSPIVHFTEITGPGLSTWATTCLSMCFVNGVFLIGGNNGGLISWDPTTTVYTVLATPKYAYVSKQFSRALAAFSLSGGSLAQATIAASVAGDQTTWTGLNAYSTTLPDVSDTITGLHVIRGLVVVGRSKGFHIGNPTGTTPAIYNWNLHSEDSVGIANPATAAIYKDTLYFVSDRGIHTFDTVDVVDIGEGVYGQLLGLIDASGGTLISTGDVNLEILRGWISTGYASDNRPQYHIVVDTNAAAATGAQTFNHFIYDITEKKWSLHDYSSLANNTFPITAYPSSRWIIGASNFTIRNTVGVMIGKTNTVPSTFSWQTPPGSLDEASSLTTGQFEVSPGWQDYQCSRVLVTFLPQSSNTTFTLLLTAQQAGVQVSSTVTYTVPASASGWQRAWFNTRLTGNFFQATFTTPAISCDVKEMFFEISDEQTVRT